MCVQSKWLPVRCVLLILIVVFEYSLNVSAKMNVTNKTYLNIANCSQNIRSTVIDCNKKGKKESASDFDFSFDEIQDDVMDFLSQSYTEDEDTINERRTNNTSDVENRKKTKGILNIGGRNQMLNIIKLAKGIYKKNMGTLLLAYKLKFFTLFPLLVSAMMVIVKASGLAGFFFALFIGSVAIRSFAHG